MKKETIKRVFFIFVGILLLLSLILCVYTVSLDRKYVRTTAYAGEVVKVDGKYSTEFKYIVAGEELYCPVISSKEIKEKSKTELFYKQDKVTECKLEKTSKLIFVCPVIGLVIWAIFIFESMKKKKLDEEKEEEQYRTKVISILGQTQKLKILTDGETGAEYAKSLEETIEVPVKSIIRKKNEIEVLDEGNIDIFEKSLRKLRRRNNVSKESKKVIPNYYYVSNGALVYEEFGKGVDEISFDNITKVIKTINKEGNVIKLVVVTDNCQYVLTNMGKCDIETTANLLHNKLIAINEGFEFEVENKEC